MSDGGGAYVSANRMGSTVALNIVQAELHSNSQSLRQIARTEKLDFVVLTFSIGSLRGDSGYISNPAVTRAFTYVAFPI